MPKITGNKIVKTTDETDVQDFISNKTPSQIATWFIDDFGNLTQSQQNKLKMLVKIVVILTKKILK